MGRMPSGSSRRGGFGAKIVIVGSRRSRGVNRWSRLRYRVGSNMMSEVAWAIRGDSAWRSQVGGQRFGVTWHSV